MDFTLYWFMFPASILVATCAMLSGIGGAALFTPIFILLFPLLGPEYVLGSTIAAIGTALITQTFGFLSGFVGYYRRKLIDYRLASRIIVVSVPVAVAGALTAGVVHDSVLLASYAVLVAVLSVVMRGRDNRDGTVHDHRFERTLLQLRSAAAGAAQQCTDRNRGISDRHGIGGHR
jgi:uncharacterized membrane protein YfcA